MDNDNRNDTSATDTSKVEYTEVSPSGRIFRPFHNLTGEQIERIEGELNSDKNFVTFASPSSIACKLGLTKEYVQDYIKARNSGQL